MGHKVHPTGFRIGVIRDWDAKWYADKYYKEYLQEDLKLRKEVRSMYPEAGVSLIEIDRQANNVALTIHTARPGILIGRGGQRVDEMRARLESLIGKRVQLNIQEISQPELDAYLVAKSIAEQMERRISYRRTLKQSMLRCIQAGAKGMRVSCAGRLDGAEIARRVTMHEGQVPLHTLRADIDYGFTEARTTMGRIGVKVWIYKGEILPESRIEEEEEMSAEIAEEPMAEAPAAAEAEPVQPPVVEPAATAPTDEAVAEKVAETPVAAVEETEEEVVAEKVEEEPTAVVEEAKAEEETEEEQAGEAPAESVETKTEEEPQAEVEPAEAKEEKKPAKRATRKPTAEAKVKEKEEKTEDTPDKTEKDKSDDIDIATNQEESDATT